MLLVTEGAIFDKPKVESINSKGKAIFRTVLQEVDTVNKNRRIYKRSVVEEGLLNAKSRIKGRSFYCEMDHPIPTGNATYDEIRQSVPMLQNSCAILRDYDFDGNLVVGQLETLSTDRGRDLYGLLQDKTGVGISLRGLAEVRKNRDNIFEVQSPLVVIAYDLVSSPSYSKAIVSEVKFESKDLLDCFSLSTIHESCNNKLVCTADGKCFVAEYFDRLVEENILKIQKKWL
jgi:hypothetical protein